MKKKSIESLIAKIKESKRNNPTKPDRSPIRLDIDYSKMYPVRDMRQEAMENGSHGAKEYFGKGDQV